MFKGTQSIEIQAPQEKVFEVAASYPIFVRFFNKKSRILSQSESETSVEVHTNLLGILPSVWQGHGIKRAFNSISFTQTVGLFQGLIADWQFEKKGNVTVASITTSFSKPHLGRFIEKLLGDAVVEKTTKKILIELKSACEKRR